MRKIINNDCFNILPKIPGNSIDLICTDPPYNINYTGWDNPVDYDLLFSQFKRILKPTGNVLIFNGWSHVANTISIADKYLILNNWIIYDRIKCRGAKRNLASTREDLLWYVKDKTCYTYNKLYSNIPKKTKGMGCKNNQPNRCLTNVWTDISPIVPWSKERVAHPTQKPLQLMTRIISIFSNKNNIILDPFAGSGTTLVAAQQLSRNYIGIELDTDYYNIILSRL